MPICIAERPPLFQTDPDRVVACFLHREAPKLAGDELSRVFVEAMPTGAPA